MPTNRSRVGNSKEVDGRLSEGDSGDEAPASKTDASVAAKVFDEMPKVISADIEKNRGFVSVVEGSQKGADSVKKAPWVNLFKDNRNLGKGIKLNMVDSVDDILHLKDEDVDDVEEIWGFCLVGLFSGRFPGMEAIRTIRSGWKVDCNYWIHRSGWIVFKFKSEEDRLSVLNGGPYFIYGRSLMLKNMPRCFRFGGEEFATVPVWVKLPDLPIDCWNARALSKIASRIGKPITTDKMTLTKERLSFARVMVEVDASKELVSSVEIKLPNGEIYNQFVEFEVTPKYCKKCKVFGHIEGNCGKVLEGKKQAVYVPRRMPQPGEGTMHKKGETSGNMSIAMAKSCKTVPMGDQSVNREAVVTHGDVLITGSKPDKGNMNPILLPEKSVLAAESSDVPKQPEMRPVDDGLQRLPNVGLENEGTRVINKMKQKMGPEIRSDLADSLLSEDVEHGSLPTLEKSSIQTREAVTVGGKEKETVVVTQGRQVVMRENRKKTEKGLSFASISKGKAKGNSLQSSK